MKSDSKHAKNLAQIESALVSPFPRKLGIYAKMSGPGWVQAAVTLGGGTLVGALYLGVIGGYQFMWLQPLAMLCGVVMLSAISYVSLSTSEAPFRLVKKHVSSGLAWGWLIATLIANVVFCIAQFSLGTDAVQGNFGLFEKNPFVVTGLFAALGWGMLLLSRRGGAASLLIDRLLKVLISLTVLSFMGVVVALSVQGAIDWGALFKGMLPNVQSLFSPSASFEPALQNCGESAEYWREYIKGSQRNVIIGAFGSAVGINMTFLLPYSLKAKGWGKKHRELSRFDLMLGLFVPFVLASSFLVIATSSQFHAKEDAIYSPAAYEAVVDSYLDTKHAGFADMDDSSQTALREALPPGDKVMGVILAKRSARDLATALEPFLGNAAQYVFGAGVLAMAMSSLLVLMVMNGHTIAEAVGQASSNKVFMIGAAMPALSGFFSPFLWQGGVKTAFVVPAAVIATTLLPIAYILFILLMNSRKALGAELPKKRLGMNILMVVVTLIATFASVWNLLGRSESENVYERILSQAGLVALVILIIVGVISFLKKECKSE